MLPLNEIADKGEVVSKLVFALLIAGASFCCLAAVTATAQETRAELGNVKWGRDLDAALQISKTSGRPLFVQFQEVPG